MNKNLDKQIEKFFQSKAFGVVGASSDRKKYGNKVLRCYLQHDKEVYPVHNTEQTIEGLSCINFIKNLPQQVESISIVTPPEVTTKIVLTAVGTNIKNIWMQPGADSDEAVSICKQNKINVIYGGSCVLVTLGFDGS